MDGAADADLAKDLAKSDETEMDEPDEAADSQQPSAAAEVAEQESEVVAVAGDSGPRGVEVQVGPDFREPISTPDLRMDTKCNANRSPFRVALDQLAG